MAGLLMEANNMVRQSSAKQARFVREYAVDCNGAAAAIDYLGNPILAATYVRKYGVSMEKINKAISIGSIKGCLVDGYLWVQDRAF
jgi:hypothetical protein